MANRNRMQFRKLDYEYRDLDSIPIPLDADTGVFTSPFVQLIGGLDTNNGVMPFKVDSTGRLDVIGVCPEMQADLYLNQNNPTSGLKYEVMPTTELVRIISVTTSITHTVQPDPMECHITADGIATTNALATPATATWFYGTHIYHGIFGDDVITFQSGLPDRRDLTFLFEARSCKIEMETTGGTVSNMKCRVKYAKW